MTKLDGVRELARTDYEDVPITLFAGDSVILEHRDGETGDTREVVRHAVGRPMVLTSAVIFEADAGVFGAGRAIGGAFVEGGGKPTDATTASIRTRAEREANRVVEAVIAEEQSR